MTLYYFDHAASAPRRPEVLEAMAPFLSGIVANPSGSHRAAREVKRVLEEARERVAAQLGALPGEIVFTAGGTESCHLAVAGSAHHARRADAPTRVLISAVEHHAVESAATQCATDFPDVSVGMIPVDRNGVLDLSALEDLLRDDVTVVSVMSANNETGVIQPISNVARLVRRLAPNAVLHSDAVAAAPWLDLAVTAADCDLVSVCAHKLGGPVNAGALVVRGTARPDAVVSGGGQERGRRGGTVDVAAAVGLATALELAAKDRDEGLVETRRRREELEGLLARIDGCTVTSAKVERLPAHVHVTIDGVSSEELLFLLDRAGVCAAAASSCSSGAVSLSHVLRAMEMDPTRARGALRLTFGTETTNEEIHEVANIVATSVARLRETS